MKFDINKIGKKISELLKTTDLTSNFTADDIKKGRFEAMAAALPILFWVPLARRTKSPFVLFHANNGLILFIFCCIAVILSVILSFVPGGWIISFPLWGFLAVESVFTSIEALSGNARDLCILGKLRLRLIK